MADHEQILELLARRSELSPEEETSVLAHVNTCTECNAAALAYTRQSTLLRAIPDVPVPPTLRPNVLAAIAQRPLPWWRRVRPGVAAFPGAVALIALVAVLAYAHRPHTVNHTALSTSAGTTIPTAISTARARPSFFGPKAGPIHHRHTRGRGSGGNAADRTLVPTLTPPALAQPTASQQSGSVALGVLPSSTNSSYPGPSIASSAVPTAVPAPIKSSPIISTHAYQPQSHATPAATKKGPGAAMGSGNLSSPTPVLARVPTVVPVPTVLSVPTAASMPTVMVASPLRPTPTPPATPTPESGGLPSPAAISLTPPAKSFYPILPTPTKTPVPTAPVPTPTP